MKGLCRYRQCRKDWSQDYLFICLIKVAAIEKTAIKMTTNVAVFVYTAFTSFFLMTRIITNESRAEMGI